MMKAQHVRPSAIAGSWYPGDPDDLRAEIQAYLSRSNPIMPKGNLVAIIVPHAGYIYSGQTAAYAFKLLKGKTFERVILCSPFHAMTREALLTTSFAAYQTPLGTIEVDEKAVKQIDQLLQAHHLPPVFRIQREQEHSLEIELPFLQIVLDQPFELVPLMVRSHQPEYLRTVASALSTLVEEKPTLIVASTDLSHFNPAATAEQLDQVILDDIQQLDPIQLLEDNRTGKGSACGTGAVALTLFTALSRGANHAEILHYTHSGKVTGDNHSVVGYGAAAIIQQDR